MNNSYIRVVIGCLFLLGVLYLAVIKINQNWQLNQVEKKGKETTALITNRDPGLNTMTIRYVADSKSYEKTISVSNKVYINYMKKSKFKIRVLETNPLIITWEDNRLFYKNVFHLLLLGILFVIFYIIWIRWPIIKKV